MRTDLKSVLPLYICELVLPQRSGSRKCSNGLGRARSTKAGIALYIVVRMADVNSETSAGEPPNPDLPSPPPNEKRKPWTGTFTPEYPQDVPVEHRGPFPGARINGKPATRVDAEDAGGNDWYVKPRSAHPWGTSPGMSVQDAKAFDKTACAVVDLDPKQYRLLQRRAGIGDKWTIDKLRTMNELGKGLHLKLMARVCAVRNFTTLDQTDKALEFVERIMQDEKVSVEDRLLASRMHAEVVKARTVLISQIVELTEKGQDKQETGRPKNLPPMLGVSVNVNPGHAGPASVQIQSGESATSGVMQDLDAPNE